MAKNSTTASDKEIQTVNASEVGELPPGIIDPKTFSVPAMANQFEDDFDSFATGLFLPRLQLEGSSSNLVKTRKVQAGNYIVVTGKDEFTVLGEQIDIILLTFRSKALDITDKKNIVASFEKGSSEFQRIVAAAQVKGRSKGYMYGLEFLIWVCLSPREGKFATLFMGNPTMRVEAKNFKPLMRAKDNPDANNQATLKVKLIDNGEHIWEAPVILPCTAILPILPSQEEMEMQMKTFLSPPKGTVKEAVSADEAEAAGVSTEAGGREY